ncbi:hypothetical protein RTCCBAU85039_6895 [Rhizobium tibeticum]|uniref:Uncharacterized protein n=1 Tax=Rhizobium tibeticum TaxID=501024 RepID=A0A1K0JCV6_9HYPH|nr:hypothetical protein RTCCBAU85039_6895 [Rhizobium tibeticum]
MTTPLTTQPTPRWELQHFRIRLAFSAVYPEQIQTGVTDLGCDVARRLGWELP